jgi:hypothetical protein
MKESKRLVHRRPTAKINDHQQTDLELCRERQNSTLPDLKTILNFEG